jgi:predicted ester cyclase
MRGTHQGDLFGIPPTGKQATFTGLVISRMAGGQIAEEWEHFDQLGLLQQLGVVPRI